MPAVAELVFKEGWKGYRPWDGGKKTIGGEDCLDIFTAAGLGKPGAVVVENIGKHLAESEIWIADNVGRLSNTGSTEVKTISAGGADYHIVCLKNGQSVRIDFDGLPFGVKAVEIRRL